MYVGALLRIGFLAEIVLDHLRHEVVDGLVIGRAVAGALTMATLPAR